jgi:hypothetical protein
MLLRVAQSGADGVFHVGPFVQFLRESVHGLFLCYALCCLDNSKWHIRDEYAGLLGPEQICGMPAVGRRRFALLLTVCAAWRLW